MALVMLVEDDQTLIGEIAFDLEMRGYEVVQALDGRQALDLLQTLENLPDVIVSDIAMPHLDGYQLLEAVQQEDRWRHLPFIFLTAFSTRDAMRISRELGVDDYLVKPFDPDDLVVAIENKRRRLEQYQEMAERQLNDAHRTLLNLLSHELRTPLTTIYGGVEMLSEGIATLPDEVSQDMIQIIRSGTQRMNRLVNNLLLVIQIDSGQLERALKALGAQLSLEEHVISACQAVQYELAATRPDVQFDIQSNNPYATVLAVPEFLTAMIGELVRNAVLFSPPDGTVQVMLDCDDHWARVSVSDQGYGIAEADLSIIWERFGQVNRAYHEQQGAGLGLVIAREAARVHGGECLVVSTPGEGSTFTLQLPIVNA